MGLATVIIKGTIEPTDLQFFPKSTLVNLRWYYNNIDTRKGLPGPNYQGHLNVIKAGLNG